MRWIILLSTLVVVTCVTGAAITETKSTLRDESEPTNEEGKKEDTQCNVKPPNICLTKGCVKAASAMLERMNLTADPCDDFFEFSCGSFASNSAIPEEKSEVTSFSIVTDLLQEKLQKLVKEDILPEDSAPIKMVKNLFRSCTNKDSIEKLGSNPFTDTLTRMGGWPVLEGDRWDSANFSWQQAIYNNRKERYSVHTLMRFSVGANVRNSSWKIIQIDQANLGLNREYLIKGLNDSDVNAYLNYAVEVAMLLGATKHRAQKELTEALQFQIELANISTPREERRNASVLYNLYTLKELSVEIPEIPFVKYFNEMLPSIQIDEKEIIVVSNINYFKNLSKLLAKTPKRTIANYLLWRIAQYSTTFLPKKFRDAQMKFSRVLSGKTERPRRGKECMKIVSSWLPYALANVYVTNFFNEEAKQQALELVNYIRAQFTDILNKIDWMDPITKKNAIMKASTIKSRIAYPPEILQVPRLMEYYKSLKINNGSLLENMLSLQKFETDYYHSQLRVKTNKEDWKKQGYVAIANAFYNSVYNAILFPAGILQGVFFEPDRPKYMNFGAIGYIIGHEITHGFDDTGKQYDSKGNLRNWWETETEEKFMKKAKCIIEQYGNYTVPENELKLNGINTQGENIADNGGIKEAYGGYLKWVQDNKEEEVLPGLMEYNTRQLFWLSAAQIWCSKHRPETLKSRVLTGVHSPGRFRIQGPFSNSPEFAKDWKCPLGSNMNPTQKCSIW